MSIKSPQIALININENPENKKQKTKKFRRAHRVMMPMICKILLSWRAACDVFTDNVDTLICQNQLLRASKRPQVGSFGKGSCISVKGSVC